MTPSEDAVYPPPGASISAAIRYRSDIDGMRAIAVIAVIIYHNFPAWRPGGFIGVDIFFVLSGYLISLVILSGLSREEFSFAGFYARRIRRIFPALALVLASTLAAYRYILTPNAWHDLAKYVLGGAGFVSNLLHPAWDNYFDSTPKPLMHHWSLGIEEQFYLVWPLALFLLWKLAEKQRLGGVVLAGILLVAGASFAYNLRMPSVHPSAVFFSPLARTWELMAGAALARIAMVYGEVKRRWTAELLSAAGIALVVAGLTVLDADKKFPGWWTKLPVAGTVLLVWAGSKAWLHRWVLASRPLVAIGLISYPLYLWHWPLPMYLRIVQYAAFDLSPQRETTARLILIMLALILSWATYLQIRGNTDAILQIPRSGISGQAAGCGNGSCGCYGRVLSARD